MNDKLAVSLLLSLPSPVILLDKNQCILYANCAAEDFFSQSLNVLRGKKIKSIMPHDDSVNDLLESVNEAHTLYRYDIAITLRNRRSYWVDIYVSLFEQENILLCFHNRSRSPTVNQQSINKDATRLIRGMSEILAHEIKNPLSGIKGAAQLLKYDVPLEHRALLDVISKETDRVARLVEQFDVFSLPALKFEKNLNIHEILNQVIEVAKNGFGAQVTFLKEYDPSLPLLSGNYDQLVQVFLNLIKNAVEACRGQVTIRTEFLQETRYFVSQENKNIRLSCGVSIIDNGKGVKEELKNIFDPFVTSKVDGTGLGLPLVSKIIMDHSGVVEYEHVNKKTIFRVLLPFAIEE